MQKSLLHSFYLTGSLVLTFAFNGMTASQAQAIGFTFTKIADTNTPIPGGVGNFGGVFGLPSVDNNNVVFSTNEPVVPGVVNGIYSNIGGSLNVLFDTNTSTITSVDSPSFAAGNVAFINGLFRDVVYSSSGGNLNVVADQSTRIPLGIGSFTNFDKVVLDDSNVVFSGFGINRQTGIYSKAGGALEIVADNGTLVPGTTGTFTNFGDFVLGDGSVVFSASGKNQGGIYSEAGGVLEVIADHDTPVPGATDTFVSFGGLDFDNGSVAFFGSSGSQEGIYQKLGSNLRAIADLNTLLPGGTGNFIGFDAPSIDNGVAAFVGFGTRGQAGIFSTFDGSLGKVIGAGDLLDGKEAIEFFLSQEGLGDNSLAFKVNFSDGSSGIYRADAAIPTPALLPGLVGLSVAAWRKRKQAV